MKINNFHHPRALLIEAGRVLCALVHPNPDKPELKIDPPEAELMSLSEL
jgi:hypothetical protein